MSMPDYQKWKKRWVKRRADQKLRFRNFDARNERKETEAVVMNRRGQRGVERGQGEGYQWKAKTCKTETQTAPSSEPPTQRGRNASRTKFRGRSPSRKFAQKPCRICTKLPCDCWHLPESQFYKSESGCKFGDRCSYAHRQVKGQPSKTEKRMVTKVRWLL